MAIETIGKPISQKRLESILGQALRGNPPDDEEIRLLLQLRERTSASTLFQAARTIRDRHFGNRIFLYGFLYFSTYCRNNCRFCHYRRSNNSLQRYRKRPSEILDIAQRMTDAGVHLVDLTMGEDPDFIEEKAENTSRLMQVVADVKRATGLPVMVSPGVLADGLLHQLATVGADWYACYQETHSLPLFQQLRPHQNYDERMSAKLSAKKLGLLVEEGILTGIGDGIEDLHGSLKAMRSLDADQVRVMSMIPQKGTPLAGYPRSSPMRELMLIAIMRLVFQDRLIPASLDVEGVKGMRARLEAGANVITSLVPPDQGLAGVANHSLDIETSGRTPESVSLVLHTCDLQAAHRDDYAAWMTQRKSKITFHEPIKAWGKRRFQ